LSTAADNPVWYHTIDLGSGGVTAGQVDLRRVAPRVLPPDLRGRRALDVGTFDGFWAFELERRGASVVATDVDRIDDAEWPPLRRAGTREESDAWGVELGRGFRIAHAALGSSVSRVVCPVGELSVDRVGGPFDIVFVGALLLHLRDPVGALERVLSVLAPGGTLLMLEKLSVGATVRAPRRPLAEFQAASSNFTWWVPNLSALKAMVWAAGFVRVRVTGVHRPTGPMRPGVHVAIEAQRPAHGG
jgi:SAM-dependent methyltransferase